MGVTRLAMFVLAGSFVTLVTAMALKPRQPTVAGRPVYGLVVTHGSVPHPFGLRFDTHEECLLAMRAVPELKPNEVRTFDGIGCFELLEPTHHSATLAWVRP